jgi:hypothetical protein
MEWLLPVLSLIGIGSIIKEIVLAIVNRKKNSAETSLHLSEANATELNSEVNALTVSSGLLATWIADASAARKTIILQDAALSKANEEIEDLKQDLERAELDRQQAAKDKETAEVARLVAEREREEFRVLVHDMQKKLSGH